jgi:hypothetical protein
MNQGKGKKQKLRRREARPSSLIDEGRAVRNEEGG